MLRGIEAAVDVAIFDEIASSGAILAAEEKQEWLLKQFGAQRLVATQRKGEQRG